MITSKPIGRTGTVLPQTRYVVGPLAPHLATAVSAWYRSPGAGSFELTRKEPPSGPYEVAPLRGVANGNILRVPGTDSFYLELAGGYSPEVRALQSSRDGLVQAFRGDLEVLSETVGDLVDKANDAGNDRFGKTVLRASEADGFVNAARQNFAENPAGAQNSVSVFHRLANEVASREVLVDRQAATVLNDYGQSIEAGVRIKPNV